MGIKGIYKEIGPGKRISLCKLAVEHLEQTGRPFRLAIDISIWQFQVQAARGGSNPAIRTLFYRLVRLLGHSIQPIFVFDGPNKPAFKRNKRSSGRGDVVATAMAKRLIRLFGFQIHDAPGEAEAECALLQQQGIVDAVLSEDVDTIMFGCTRTLRNWSADGVKGSKTPTHVSMYETKQLHQGDSGLDREGMVLVALMSGGDYLPEGVPGCGVKVACEAARAGFGKSLCRIKRADSSELNEWRQNLRHELVTNESSFFRTKHKALTIPEDFPSLEILRYYTHPVVSSSATVDKLKTSFPATRPVDIQELREFVRETFDWTYRIGAIKYIRVLAPSMLVQRLLSTSSGPESDDPDLIQAREAVIVKGVTNRRSHFSTDATPELRVSYTPVDMVPIDLDAEPEEEVATYGRDGIALNSDDDFDEPALEATEDAGKAGTKKTFDPQRPDTIWVPESIVKLGAPLTVEDWEEKQRAKEKAKISRTAKPRPTKMTGMPVGALDKFVTVSKTTSVTTGVGGSPSKLRPPLTSLGVPPAPSAAIQQTQRRPVATAKTNALPRSKQSKKKDDTAASKQANPWTLAGSQISPRVTKSVGAAQAIVISSSPACPSSPVRGMPVKRVRTPPPPENNFASDPFKSPTRSPRKKGSPVAMMRVKATEATAAKKAARRKGDVSTDRNQMSIKSFGSLGGKKEWQTVSKPAEHRDEDRESPCIEILSDDDDEPSLPDIRTLLNRRDEDPFASSAGNSRGRQDNGLAGIARPVQPESSVSTPQTSDPGQMEEANTSRNDLGAPNPRACKSMARTIKKTVWRSSEVSIIDLTNYD